MVLKLIPMVFESGKPNPILHWVETTGEILYKLNIPFFNVKQIQIYGTVSCKETSDNKMNDPCTLLHRAVL